MQTREQLLTALDERTRSAIHEIHRALTEAGYQCYLVGGCVRDLLLGRSTGDVDLTTDARPEQVQKLFRKTIPTGIDHGTITVRLSGLSFEVTTYRSEGTYSDGRRPDSVQFSTSLSEDLKRRDFTMNALAFDPGTLQLVDEHDGMADLAARVIRTIGRPRDRFFEDALRPIRACRFAAVLGFEIEEATRVAMADLDVAERLAGIAVERIAQELWKGLAAPEVSRMIVALQEAGLIRYVLPANPEYRNLDRGALNKCNAQSATMPAFRLSLWLRLGGVQDLGAAGAALKLSRNATRDIVHYAALLDFLEQGDKKPEAGRRFLSYIKAMYGTGTESFLQGATNMRPPELDRWVRELMAVAKSAPLVAADLAISGGEIQATGLQGPAIGSAQRRLLDLVLEQPALNEREALLLELARMNERRDPR